MKIAFTGNPNYGVAEAWNKTIYHHFTDFFSRNNGWDLDLPRKRREFAKHIVEYDVFINSSALYHFHQVNLLKDVFEHWDKIGKSGRIINIGSTADRTVSYTHLTLPTTSSV